MTLIIRIFFLQTFGTPRNHPKSQPFVDHIFSFSIVDNRVWFRNYQILEENAELAEIGEKITEPLNGAYTIDLFHLSFNSSVG